jgi:hypothetical protein
MTELIDSDPSSYKEAVSQQVWRDSMAKKYSSIMRNDVWQIVPKPEGKSVIGSRWVYKIKQGVDGSVEKCKARFVAKGFSQVEGIDYDETFVPIARYSSVRVILAISAPMGWKVHQMDVKTAFLNKVVEEEIYVEQPEGFETFNRDTHVCKLKRALSGLKHAPRAWYACIDNYLLRLGFTKSKADPNLYYIVVEGQPLILVLYVDDLILTGADSLIHDCKEDLAREFEMKDLGLMHYSLDWRFGRVMVTPSWDKASMQSRFSSDFTCKIVGSWPLL